MVGKVIIVMGVSGCGKSYIGEMLSREWSRWIQETRSREHGTSRPTNAIFQDGDDFHPISNVEKMRNGIPLNDTDRMPWLQNLHKEITNWITNGSFVVLACSALKKSYRNILRGNISWNLLKIIFLDGSFDLITERLRNRKGHYMDPNLLKSQFDTLERPDQFEAITVGIIGPGRVIIEEIRQKLSAGKIDALIEYERAFLTDDHAGMLALMCDDIIFSDPLCGKPIISKDALRKYLSQAGGVLSDVTQNIEDRALQNGCVFLRWTHKGTNGVTGRKYYFSGCTFLRFKKKQVVEHRDYFDPRILISQFKEAYKHNKAIKSKF